MWAVSAFNPIDWSVTVARYGFEGARFELYGLQLELLAVLAVTCTWPAAAGASDPADAAGSPALELRSRRA